MTNFETAKIFSFENEIDYREGSVVSKQIIKSPAGNITLFAFDKGEGLSEHTAPFDAVVQVLNGVVEIKIDGTPYQLKQNDTIIMPAHRPHALLAIEAFKMVLTMIKK